MTKMGNISVLTVEGRVTIPFDVREALGLKPNEPVEFTRNTNGEVVIRRPVVQPDEDGPNLEAALHRLDAALARWKHLRTGRDPDDYMAELREPLPTPNPADL